MAGNGRPGGAGRGAAALAIAVAFAASLGAGYAVRGVEPDPATAAAEACAREAAARLAEGRVAEVWESLAPEARERFAAGHARLLEAVEAYRVEASTDRLMERAVRDMEREYGRSLADLARTRPESLWEERMLALLGPVASRSVLLDPGTARVEVHGDRAVVEFSLRDGRPQGFHLIRRDGEWAVLDFRPYTRIPAAPTPGAMASHPAARREAAAGR